MRNPVQLYGFGDLWAVTDRDAVDAWPGKYIMAIAFDSSNRAWFATEEGVYRWNGNGFDAFAGPNRIAGNPEASSLNWVNSILMDSRGHLFFNSSGAAGGISEYDGTHWKVYNEFRDSPVITLNPQGLLTLVRGDTLVTLPGQGGRWR